MNMDAEADALEREVDRLRQREADLVARLDRIEKAAMFLLDDLDKLQLPSMSFRAARDLVQAAGHLRRIAVERPS